MSQSITSASGISDCLLRRMGMTKGLVLGVALGIGSGGMSGCSIEITRTNPMQEEFKSDEYVAYRKLENEGAPFPEKESTQLREFSKVFSELTPNDGMLISDVGGFLEIPTRWHHEANPHYPELLLGFSITMEDPNMLEGEAKVVAWVDGEMRMSIGVTSSDFIMPRKTGANEKPLATKYKHDSYPNSPRVMIPLLASVYHRGHYEIYFKLKKPTGTLVCTYYTQRNELKNLRDLKMYRFDLNNMPVGMITFKEPILLLGDKTRFGGIGLSPYYEAYPGTPQLVSNVLTVEKRMGATTPVKREFVSWIVAPNEAPK